MTNYRSREAQSSLLNALAALFASLFSYSVRLVHQRFYRNTFTDLEKQHIMDVFLGVFRPSPDIPHIWELGSDLRLHNLPPVHLHQPLYPDNLVRRVACFLNQKVVESWGWEGHSA